MKQKILSCCALGLAFSLSACGGGGGGGSGGFGGGGGGGFTTITKAGVAGSYDSSSGDVALSGADETAENLASPGSGMQEKLKAGFVFGESGEYTMKAGSLTIEDAVGILSSYNTATLYTKNSVDYAVLADTPRRISFAEFQNLNGTSGDDVFEGTIDLKSFVWFGKLDHAGFGYWAQVADIVGTTTHNGITYNNKDTIAVNGGLFYDGKQANFQGTGLSFTGLAAGAAEYFTHTGNVVAPLVGNATLNIGAGGAGTLVLAFPNFYTFTGSVNASAGSSGFSGSFDTAVKAANYSPVIPYDLKMTDIKPGKNNIEGNLYGASATTPTEAAGAWEMTFIHNANDQTKVQGVFGVKQ